MLQHHYKVASRLLPLSTFRRERAGFAIVLTLRHSHYRLGQGLLQSALSHDWKTFLSSFCLSNTAHLVLGHVICEKIWRNIECP